MKAIKSEIILLEGYPTVKNSYVEIEDYTEYYKHLNCHTFDVVRVTWLDEEISIFVDDEGLLKPSNYGREVIGYKGALFGNMVICGGVDPIGNTLAIPEKFDVMTIGELISSVMYVTKGK